MAIIILTCEANSRVHLINVSNFHVALDTLRKLYEDTNLSIIDISYKKINRSNLKFFFNIEAYGQHLKAHKEKIIQTEKNMID